jgi:hypothetical protein
MLGHCVADDPEEAEEEAFALADRRLSPAIEELKGDRRGKGPAPSPIV